jgi:hypothetical protein
MKDRFDLESDLMSCWNVVDDINLLLETVMDSPRYSDMPPEVGDMLSNSLLGIKELYDMRFQKLWNTFLDVNKLDEYKDQ